MPKLNVTIPNTGSSSSGNFDLAYRGAAGERRQPVMIWTATRPNPLKFWVNPSECQWRIATRTSIEPIQGGVVHHEWDSQGIGFQAPQKFDQAVVNFSFQSGLIIPNGTNDRGDISSEVQEAAPGLSNFYDFLEILNQPNVTDKGIPNYVQIQYVSAIFPSLLLQGQFSAEGVQWTDTADNPNQIMGWGASFVVFSSTPALFDSGLLKSTFKDAYFS